MCRSSLSGKVEIEEESPITIQSLSEIIKKKIRSTKYAEYCTKFSNSSDFSNSYYLSQISRDSIPNRDYINRC